MSDSRRRPVRVDLPASTWPRMTRERCVRRDVDWSLVRMCAGSCGGGVLLLLLFVVSVLAFGAVDAMDIPPLLMPVTFVAFAFD